MKKLKLQQRGKSKYWYIRPTINGKPKYIKLSKSKATSETIARQYTRQSELKEVQGFNAEADINLAAEQYLKDKMDELSTSKSKAKYRLPIRMFQEYVKDKGITRVSDCDKRTVKDFLSMRQNQDKVANATWNNDRFVLSNFFQYCFEEKWIDENPVKTIKKKKVSEMPVDHLDKTEVKAFLEYEQSQKDRYRVCWCEIIATIAYTGLRVREATHLLKSDVDLKNDFIRIGKKAERDWTPKNKEFRVIPIIAELRPIIKQQMNDEINPTEILFPNMNNNYIDADDVREHIQRSCAEAGFKRITTHSLRHSFCSTAIANGIPEPIVQKILGHKSASMTKHYTHLAPNDIKEKMKGFGYE